MTSFRKHLFIGMAAFSLGVGSVASLAQTPDGGPMGDHGNYGERMKEHMAKRAAELHDKLKLNAEQEKAWNAYMDKVKPGEPPVRPDRGELDKLTAPERMERRLAHMKEAEKRMEQHVAATKEFYAVLTPEQKKVFDEAFRHGPGSGRHWHGGPRR
ncbi:MAG: Spy/CpxP family protein refolding chaperone [Bacillota bacterium]